jgi:hypothetical protein
VSYSLPVCLALTLAVATAVVSEPITLKEWDFHNGIQGWTTNNPKPLRIEDGALVVDFPGTDVGIFSPDIDLKTAPNQVAEVRLKSTMTGTAEWFWRSDTKGPYGGYSGEASERVLIAESADFQTIRARPAWQDRAQIINIRFDMPENEGPGVYRIASIRILGTTSGKPVPADFDFAKGTQDWWLQPTGALAVTRGGVRAALSATGTQIVSPIVDLDPAATPWVSLDVTTPAALVPDGRIPATLVLSPEGRAKPVIVPVYLAAGRRGSYSVRIDRLPGLKGHVQSISLGIAAGVTGDLVLHSLRAAKEPAPVSDLNAPATGLEMQTQAWRREYRLAVAPQRIDVATQAPPETKPVSSDYTVAMWYFAAWEPEYTWDGWGQVGERSPWRIPLLYDSTDAQMRYNGIQFYRASNQRVLDWHVHWMCEHAINLMLWDWYPQEDNAGNFTPGFFGNRALEIGFLGKQKLGDPPVATNRFAGGTPGVPRMDFAVMWTNHAGHNGVGRGLAEYIVDQFMLQPNYYKMDGRPLLILWSVDDLVNDVGGVAKAKAALDHLRDYAKQRGVGDPYIAVVNGARSPAQIKAVGIDGITGYNYCLTGGSRQEPRRVGDRTVQDYLEDFPTQTIPGHTKLWAKLADTYGRDYLLATSPMQDWEPTFRDGNYIMQRNTPDAYREMLRRAKATIEQKGLRKFINMEAWNEWLEGSYMEPSTQWGYEYLEAVKDVMGSGK